MATDMKNFRSKSEENPEPESKAYGNGSQKAETTTNQRKKNSPKFNRCRDKKLHKTKSSGNWILHLNVAETQNQSKLTGQNHSSKSKQNEKETKIVSNPKKVC